MRHPGLTAPPPGLILIHPVGLLQNKISGSAAPVSKRQKSRQRRLGWKNELSSTLTRVSFRGLRRYLPAHWMP